MSKFKKGQLCRVTHNLFAPQCVGQTVEIIGVAWEKEGRVYYHTREGSINGISSESCLESLEKKVLDLVLMHKWYDMIDVGDKPEEYRSISPYWMKRLLKTSNIAFTHYEEVDNECADFYCKNIDLLKTDFEFGGFRIKDYTHIRFHRGYTSTTMLWTLEGMKIGKGREEWGAPKEEVFIIKLGERI